MRSLESTPATARPPSGAHFRHSPTGIFGFISAFSAAFMADNIEHVISYWMMFQKFHRRRWRRLPVSHWLPFLLLGEYAGALADRFDIRRLIQISMLLFAGVSICWGIMF